jgi:hypothetical protein
MNAAVRNRIISDKRKIIRHVFMWILRLKRKSSQSNWLKKRLATEQKDSPNPRLLEISIRRLDRARSVYEEVSAPCQPETMHSISRDPWDFQ